MNQTTNDPTYDAILVVSFGGPEGPDDVMPFLDNVLRGRNIPHERKLEVARHYQHFGGVSPINGQNRELIAALQKRLAEAGPELPIYWGNRNWHPLLIDCMQQMQQDGIKRALALVTSAFSCYSGCRQYRENIAAAQEAVGADSPQVDKLRVFFNHPGYVEAMADRIQTALDNLPEPSPLKTQLVYTAHSIPLAMADGSLYVAQLREASRLVSELLGWDNWKLVYQSRSGPPNQPWLEPDICDYLKQVRENKMAAQVVVVPIGFVSDHMEVVFDLDIEARDVCAELDLPMVRAATVGNHPKFVEALRQLIVERMSVQPERLALGTMGPSHDVCPEDCCPSGRATRP